MKQVTLILPKEYSIRIYRISYLAMTSIITSYQLNLFDYTALSTFVFMTSLNYWRYPLNNYRRKIDMSAVTTYFIYQNINAIKHIKCHFYYFFVIMGLFCYYNSNKTKCHNKSSLWHCGLHLCANISNIIFYYRLYIIKNSIENSINQM
jgi:hypothetical protein